MLTEIQARALLESAHAEWNRRSVIGVLSRYSDALTFWCNVGSADGKPLVIRGKPEFRAALDSFLRVARCTSRVISFEYVDGVGRGLASYNIEHLSTGHTMVGRFRQVVTFEDQLISRMEEYHDAARFTAFWRMVADGGAPGKLLWNESRAAEKQT